jgi:hypothetical protein
MKRNTTPRKSSGTIRTPRTRNGNTETEAQHFGKIRSALRSLTRFTWEPKKQCLKNAQCISYTGKKKIVLYKCAMCAGLYTAKQVEVDHIIPVGTLRSYSDLAGFCERLFVEDPALLRVVCEDCHQKITNLARAKRKM